AGRGRRFRPPPPSPGNSTSGRAAAGPSRRRTRPASPAAGGPGGRRTTGRRGRYPPGATAGVVGEPQVAAGVTGGFDGRVVPLQHPLGVGEAAVFLRVRRGGQEEHL